MNAVITAGGPIGGTYAALAGTSRKALAPLRDGTMLDAGIRALRGCGVARIAVVGDEAVARAVGTRATMVADTGSGSGNVLAALDAWSDTNPLLYLTCDLPFVDEASLRSFLDRIDGAALSMALCDHATYVARFPGAPRAGITLAGERVVNGGAFYFPAGSLTKARAFAGRLFDARKAPWRMASIAGPALLVRFFAGRLSVAHLEARGLELLGLPVRGVRGCAPELCFDADTVADYRYALDCA